MKKNNSNKVKLIDIILPNKRINFFIITVLILGIISGSLFLMMTTDADKSSVINQIGSFFSNISTDSVDSGLAFKNSLIINYLFVFIIWGLGLSMIGVVINLFLTFLKGFLVGFSVGALFLTYSYKGVLASVLYVFLGQIFNIGVVIVLTIYSVMFSLNLFKIITKGGNNRLMLKRYIVILMFCIIISFISSILEVYLFPSILKLVVKYYL